MLRGRTKETGTIDALLAAARRGTSGALVIRGEAGIGKTALLDHTASRADGMRVLRTTGVEAESELPYAGLSMLVGGLLDRLDDLPVRQAAALRGALGLGEADGDTFLIGLAVLGLLAEEAPLLCLVDDAQWLDAATADAVLFAARRLLAEGVVMMFAVRAPYAPDFPSTGLPELRLGGLADEAAAALVGDLAPHVRDEVLVEARGNPLALRVLAEARREQGTGMLSVGLLPVQNRILQTFDDRIRALPAATRTVLLVAAADDTGDLSTVLRAAERLGAGLQDLDPAEAAGLLRVEGDRLVFGHPLMRSAAYQGATVNPRIEAHRALAEILDGDRRAWHLAAAATGPDEQVAAALERTAQRARDRGGYAAVAAAYERAAALTPDPGERERRRLAAARAAADAGQFERADHLVRHAGSSAEAAALRAVIADGLGRTEEAHVLLFESAATVTPAELPPLLRSAARAAWRANDFKALDRIAACVAEGSDVHRLATAALATNRLDDGGIETLKELLALPPQSDVQDRLLFARLHLIIGDIEGAMRLAGSLERECRSRGALGVLPAVQTILGRTLLFTGRHTDARATLADGLQIADDTCQRMPRVELSATLAELAAIEGEEERCRALTAEAIETGLAPSAVHAAVALSLLDLGLGRHEAALDRMEAVVSGSRPMGVMGHLPILIEAAVRLGQPRRAASAVRLFTAWADRVGQPWASAVALRCQALLADDVDTFAQAVQIRTYPFEQARTELLYGERLRRDRRTSEARGHLRGAAETFERLGARPWAERARGELRATGETRLVRGHATDLADRLTPQELQSVRLAATGLSNREIAERLFVSPRTVGHHLYKAYPKLGVTTRAELASLGL
ncbi:helix-turn-helix transcriptional regulator [Nonomuraea dietziae]|uniref:helix-turn-helix transcriptional regulator n=1 Tax=Nonomuraea dietziae TaxID=65515 RepID=UPI0033F09425